VREWTAQARAVCSHCWSTRHTTHLLWRAKGQRIVLVLLRRVAIGPNLPARPDRTPPPPGVTRVWHRRRGGGRRRAGAHGAVAAAAHTLLAYSGTLSPRWYVLPFASTTCRDSHHRPAGAPHRACRRERGGERERVRRCAARAGVPARGRAPAGQRPPARRQGSFASPARRVRQKKRKREFVRGLSVRGPVETVGGVAEWQKWRRRRPSWRQTQR